MADGMPSASPAPAARRPREPLRILHVVGSLQRGGVETWLMNALRRLDRERVRFDFVTLGSHDHGAYDDEARALGARVLRCPVGGSRIGFARRFLRLLRQEGPFDAVHSHVYTFSGVVLGLARAGRVPMRIAHAHTTPPDTGVSAPRRAYARAMRGLVRANATLGVAAGDGPAAALFGDGWRDRGGVRLMVSGIDLKPFRQITDAKATRAEVRGELGIPDDALVVGHVGRFIHDKNQGFLLRVLAALRERELRSMLVFVGEGDTRASVEASADNQGLRGRVRFAGVRADVPRLLHAFDVFSLPSRREGLPLVLSEAQAAGVPCVYSDAVSEAMAIVPQLTRSLSPSLPAEAWAEAILAARASSRPPAQEALEAVERSRFNIANGARELRDLYLRAAPGARG